MPRGHPSCVKEESVPTEDSSMIVLETSAGNGFTFRSSVGADSQIVETEHVRARYEILRKRHAFREANRDFEVGFNGATKGANWFVRVWAWRCIWLCLGITYRFRIEILSLNFEILEKDWGIRLAGNGMRRTVQKRACEDCDRRSREAN